MTGTFGDLRVANTARRTPHLRRKPVSPAALRDRQACKRPPDSEMGNLFANLGGNEQKETS